MTRASKITILMYHDVRNLDQTKFPKRYSLKSFLREQQFRNQIKYIKKYYNVVSAKQILDSIENKNSLPKNPILLTFDDGLADHYNVVCPILVEEKIVGCFFVPVDACKNKKPFLAHKVQYILAGAETEQILVKEIFDLLPAFRQKGYPIEEDNKLWSTYSQSLWVNNWWSQEMVFVTRLLREDVLPNLVRDELVDLLFKKFAYSDEKELADDLYMNVQQIKSLKASMEIGGHGFASVNLATLNPSQQRKDIEDTCNFLRTEILNNDDDFIFSYPNGGYNQDTVDILKQTGCKAAFTVEPTLCSESHLSNMLTLPRLCAPQQFPQTVSPNMCKWTKEL